VQAGADLGPVEPEMVLLLLLLLVSIQTLPDVTVELICRAVSW